LLVIFYLSFYSLPHSGKFPDDFFRSFANWDGGHFLGIAEVGYSQKFQYAFFPFYPLFVRMLSQITGNYLLSAILISTVSTFFGLQILYRLIIETFDKKIGEKTVLAFLFFPTSFFLLTAYSEGLFFFLTVSAFYFYRKNLLFWAVVAASLASATRLVGLAIVLGLWVDILGRQGINRRNFYILFAPLGFIIYCVYLYFQTGDFFYFLTAQTHWQRTLTAPVLGFWETIRQISVGGFTGVSINIFLDLIFAVFGVGMAIRAFRFLPSIFAIYTFAAVLIPLFTPTLSSIPRFLLMIFPIFILVALIKNRYLALGYQVISLLLLAYFSTLFITGFWVS